MRRTGLGFVPGAVAATFVSTDGRTFTEPPANWTLGKWFDRSTFFAGSPQSLAGDLIREGVTGVAAQVAEPYFDASVRPDVLFPAYVSGFNLAESFYLAMPFLSWQTVVVGDPLCAPFARTPLQPAAIDKGLDPATELPAWFAARRLAVLTKTTTPDAAKAVLRSEARFARDDKRGAMQALEEATAADPKLVSAHLVLAGEYEAQSAFDKAIERYRMALSASPDNLIALNNLAYALAVRKGEAAEALGHAERAMRLSGGRSPEIADTLAWVQHLLGRDQEASVILSRIVKAEPERAVFRLHAAAVLAALGKLEEAAAELREAVRLDPELEKSDEAKAVRAKLGR
jgi:tetratricopeptide (TPR) repeat protein